MYRLLQLSDLHFGGSHFFRQGDGDPDAQTLAGAIGDAVQPHLGGELDCLVLGGDFFSTDHPNERALAAQGLDDLVARLGPQATVAVPGNHDLTWSGILHDDPFYFYDRLVEGLDAPARSSDLPQILELTRDGLKPLALVLMNSCRLESEAMAGIGRFGEPQLAQIHDLIEQKGVTPSSHVIIAIHHHHLLPIAAVEGVPEGSDPREGPPPHLSHTVDAVEAMRRLSELGVVAVLHGHQHRRAVLRHENLAWGTRPVYVVASGSCGLKQARRQFFLLEIEESAICVTSFAQHAENEALFEHDRELGPIPLPLA